MVEYIKWATRPSSVAREYFLMKGFQKYGLKSYTTIKYKNGIGEYFLEKKSYYQILKKVLYYALKNCKKHIGDYAKIKKEILEAGKKLNKKRTYKNYIALNKKLEKFLPYIIMPFSLNELIEDELREKLKDGFEILSKPTRKTEYYKMLEYLSKHSPRETAKKYGWLNVYSLVEKPYNEEFFRKIKIPDIDKKNKEFKNNRKEYYKLIKRIKNDKLKRKAILFHTYVYMRDDRVDTWKKVLFLMKKMFLEISTKSGHSLEACANLTPCEIKEYFLNKKLPRDIEKRKGEIAYYIKNKKIIVITDKKKIENIKKHIMDRLDSKLNGKVAYFGKAVGPAKIIKSYSDLKKIKKGDIMVTVTTDPRYNNAIKKVKGIIAEEGGTLTHTSIIARELKIPCIVGVKDATNHIKENEIIKIDGEKIIF